MLVGNKWEKSHKSRALHRFGEHTLVFGSEAGALAVQDSAVGVEKPFEVFYILVVDEPDAVCVKIILFHKVRTGYLLS